MMSNHVEHDPVGTQTTGDSVSFEWRKARYEEMGFTTGESQALANAKVVEYTGKGTDKDPKKEWPHPLHWEKVKAALDAGCTKEMALQIFVD